MFICVYLFFLFLFATVKVNKVVQLFKIKIRTFHQIALLPQLALIGLAPSAQTWTYDTVSLFRGSKLHPTTPVILVCNLFL